MFFVFSFFLWIFFPDISLDNCFNSQIVSSTFFSHLQNYRIGIKIYTYIYIYIYMCVCVCVCVCVCCYDQGFTGTAIAAT